MAKATLQPTLLRFVGPIGGIVAATRHHDATLRSKYHEPGGSPAQRRYRALFRQVDTAYAERPADTRGAWATRAKQLRMSPYTLWMRTNLPRAYQGLPLQPLP